MQPFAIAAPHVTQTGATPPHTVHTSAAEAGVTGASEATGTTTSTSIPTTSASTMVPTESTLVSVIVVDDHPLFRRGIVQLVDEQPDFQVVADLDSGAGLMDVIDAHQPSLILLDLNMPEISGLTLLQRIKQHSPDMTVVMITASEQDSDLFQALSKGANGYLMKDTAPEEMIQRIHQALSGQVALNDHSVTLLAQSLHQPPSQSQSHPSDERSAMSAPPNMATHHHHSTLPTPHRAQQHPTQTVEVDLTTREQQTLALISKGLNNKLIARELGISDGTVKVYVKSLLRKLALHSRLELAAWVHRHPYIIEGSF